MLKFLCVAIILFSSHVSAVPVIRAASDADQTQSYPVQKLQPTIKSAPLHKAVQSIPVDIIRPFLTQSRFVTPQELDNAPYILDFNASTLSATQDTHLFVHGMNYKNIDQFAIFGYPKKLVDPETQATVGYILKYLGRAVAVRKGETSILRVLSLSAPILKGDVVLPFKPSTDILEFIPTKPKKWVEGHIIDTVSEGTAISLYEVVAINRGRQHSLRAGDMLDIQSHNRTVPTRTVARYMTRKHDTLMKQALLPGEYIGKLMVFKVFERWSYGLVLDSSLEIPAHAKVTSSQHIG